MTCERGGLRGPCRVVFGGGARLAGRVSQGVRALRGAL
jgi:hypothetical protein